MCTQRDQYKGNLDTSVIFVGCETILDTVVMRFTAVVKKQTKENRQKENQLYVLLM